MEDLLWVLTDDQLKAALHFADSLTGLLKRATEESQKIKGARKLEVRKVTHPESGVSDYFHFLRKCSIFIIFCYKYK